MALTDLTTGEIEVIGRALQLFGRGQLVEEWEFHTLTGLKLIEFRDLLHRWPNWDDRIDSSLEHLAIHNGLGNLLNFITEDECQMEIGVTRKELDRVYRKWKLGRGWDFAIARSVRQAIRMKLVSIFNWLSDLFDLGSTPHPPPNNLRIAPQADENPEKQKELIRLFGPAHYVVYAHSQCAEALLQRIASKGHVIDPEQTQEFAPNEILGHRDIVLDQGTPRYRGVTHCDQCGVEFREGDGTYVSYCVLEPDQLRLWQQIKSEDRGKSETPS